MEETHNNEYPDTMLFLGAGASQFAGYHTFQRFGNLITDPLIRHIEGLPAQSPETPRLIESLNQALTYMQRPTTHDNYLWLLNDYRTFCGKFDTHLGLQERFPRIRDDVHVFEFITETVINDLTQTTYCHYSRKRDLGLAGSEIRSLYEEMALLNNNEEPFLPIFTTNYDLLLEDMFKDNNYVSTNSIPLINGIPELTSNGAQWSPEFYNLKGIHLYRMHGCVAWFRPSEDEPKNPISFERPETLDDYLLRRLCVMFPGHELEVGNDPHGFAFKRLYHYFLHCKKAIFIGFSFRDDDVMHILLAANANRSNPIQIGVFDSIIGKNQIMLNLYGAAMRSKFMSNLPPSDTIKCERMDFGETGCKQKILEFINK